MRHRRSPVVPLSRHLIAGFVLCFSAPQVLAVEAAGLPFALPDQAMLIGNRAEAMGSHSLPTGPWRDGVIPAKMTEGDLQQKAWRLPLDGRSTLELLAPLRAQVTAAGFTPVYECDTLACGGFDFRFGTDILPEPQMHVDLGDFRYFAAERQGADGPEYISVIVSRSAAQGFVQVTRIGPALAVSEVTTSTKSEPAPTLPGMTLPDMTPAEMTAVAGFILAPDVAQVLADLTFSPGRADLLGEAPAITRLRDWLAANPAARIDLIGHSDSSGDPVANTALSLARAETVRDRLTGAGIAADRITARGLGPVSPIADNATAEGRQKNRRVEVMLTPTR